MVKRLFVALLLLSSTIVIAIPASAGGWASVRLVSTSVDPNDPRSWELVVVVMQHDITPFDSDSVVAHFVNAESGETLDVIGEARTQTGEYRFKVALPGGGSWNWTVTPAPFAAITMSTLEAGQINAASDAYVLEGRIWGGDCLNLQSSIAAFPITHSSGQQGTLVDYGIVPGYDVALEQIADGSFAVTIFGELNGEVIKKCREVDVADGAAPVTIWETPGTTELSSESWTLIPNPDGESATFVSIDQPTANFATVTISDDLGGSFDTPTLTVPIGTTVTWVNKSTIAHTVSSSEFNFGSSGMLDPGQLFSQTFNEPGTYPYVCDPHPGMAGTVIVTGS